VSGTIVLLHAMVKMARVARVWTQDSSLLCMIVGPTATQLSRDGACTHISVSQQAG
jgi:hypothetical protein